MNRVEIVEVGPRDGLQNETALISVEDKVRLITACAASGLKHIEVGALVSPKWVPQMADTERVIAQTGPLAGVTATILVPNMRGLSSLMDLPDDGLLVQEIAVFVSATEGFSQANLNCSVADSLTRVGQVLSAVRDQTVRAPLQIRGYISCVTDCPYEGAVPPASVAHVAQKLRALGCDTLSLGDTIGQGTPERVTTMLTAVLEHWPAHRLAGHFHDTGGHALQNVDAALEAGLRIFDSSVAGLGGCPYAPGAPGNLATEQLAAHLAKLGYDTGVDEACLAKVARLAREIVETARDG